MVSEGSDSSSNPDLFVEPLVVLRNHSFVGITGLVLPMSLVEKTPEAVVHPVQPDVNIVESSPIPAWQAASAPLSSAFG